MLPGKLACETRKKSRLACLVDNYEACFRTRVTLSICSRTEWNKYLLPRTVHVFGIASGFGSSKGLWDSSMAVVRLCLYGTRPSCVTVCPKLIKIYNTML